MGGDWNCTTEFTLDRRGQEPHLRSSTTLSQITLESDVVDVWRLKHPQVRQYTWVRVVGGNMSVARLDRFYMTIIIILF